MVISRVIRRNKQTVKNSVDIDTKPRKISTREKIISTLKDHKRGLPLMELADKANVSSGGNIHQTVKFMLKERLIIKESCPHCNATELYKLNI